MIREDERKRSCDTRLINEIVKDFDLTKQPYCRFPSHDLLASLIQFSRFPAKHVLRIFRKSVQRKFPYCTSINVNSRRANPIIPDKRAEINIARLITFGSPFICARSTARVDHGARCTVHETLMTPATGKMHAHVFAARCII